MSEDKSRVLFVDDDAAVLRAYRTALTRLGHAVETAANGKEALARLDANPFDVIVSDVTMPEMDGLEFLRAVRQRDLDVPVILMTGELAIDPAMRAIEYGVFRYLLKPVEPQMLDDIVRRAVRLHQMARLKRQALEVAGVRGRSLGDRASLEARFARALDTLWVAYQPVVSWRERRVFGYEALVRSAEPTLLNPLELLECAERLGSLHQMGRAIRQRVAFDVAQAPASSVVFVNLHAADLDDEQLYAPEASLGRFADRVVLEITERASLETVANVEQRMKQLRGIGFRIAIDDLGAGYAGLSSFTLLEPTIAKLDMSLIRDIDTHARKQSIVRSMNRLCDELKITVVAEGVETPSERDTLVDLGCDLLQGYLFARPESGFPIPRW
jgi:EAL domain-containing protein (putative c-di-GMP-specific phosphodiesterase class I)